jgi:hypothetical protein
MRINVGESLVAVAIMAIAAVAYYIGAGYPRGTLSQMGAGYFPVMTSAATALCGLLVLANVALSPEAAPTIRLRPTLLALSGMLVWALCAERFGLIPASIGLIMLASAAQTPFRPWTTIVLALVGSAAAVAIFIYGFDLPLRPLKW